MPLPLPAGARRLFPSHDLAAVPGDPAAPELPAVIARLLEDGDSADLEWLIGAAGEPALAAWLERHGARQLSRRSLAFWELALGRRARPASAPPGLGLPPAAELPRKALWPL